MFIRHILSWHRFLVLEDYFPSLLTILILSQNSNLVHNLHDRMSYSSWLKNVHLFSLLDVDFQEPSQHTRYLFFARIWL